MAGKLDGGSGRRGKGWGGCKGFGSRDGANFATCVVVSNASKEEKWLFLKDARGVAGGCSTGAGLVDGGVREAGQGLGGGARASVPGVSGRDTGVRDGANFATCVVFLSFLTRTKRRKMAFFEGWPGRALVAGEGWGGRRGDGSSKKGGGWLGSKLGGGGGCTVAGG